MLHPGATIGIVGGGQLGRMLAMSAARLGFRTIVLDPDTNAPAFQIANETIIAPYDDADAIKALAEKSDVITYEFENVPVSALETVVGNVPVHPNTKALATSQDRLIEKDYFRSLDIGTAPYWDCPTEETFEKALEEASGKGILKTRRFGYDGKGQVRVGSTQEASLAEARNLIGSSPSIFEGFVEFECEISIIASRGTDGSITTFDPARNVHREGILRTSTVPAEVPATVEADATSIARQVLEGLDYIGTMGIEFFVLADGTLLVNEFAPRVHNSGHWTEAACPMSQFDQHIRAIAGLPLPETNRHSDCRMENLIGDDMDKVPDILREPSAFLHLYGKSDVRTGRKMGHVTRIFPKTA